jgi:hypothetical protein
VTTATRATSATERKSLTGTSSYSALSDFSLSGSRDGDPNQPSRAHIACARLRLVARGAVRYASWR